MDDAGVCILLLILFVLCPPVGIIAFLFFALS